uniref:AB hydrolase-1 domain-containing protein n=1 Tax=Bionectria ochroleuca TaxID=29856 RepID=A0A8H7NHA4_BIOOC
MPSLYFSYMDGQVSYLNALRHLSAMTYMVVGNHTEFLKVLGILRQKYSPNELPYHVIVPSLPGYTLSSGPPLTKDWNTEDIGRIMNKLMIGLGFGNGYISQGGDIGAFVSWVLAVNHKECHAIHVNFAIGQEPQGVVQSNISDAERQGLQRLQNFLTSGNAYFQEHNTRPATIGYVLSSSPLALLAWIGEKFIEWTDTTPDYEEILDSVTLYWFTESIARGLYPYRTPHGTPGLHPLLSDPKYYCEKPLGYSSFPHELGPTPVEWLRKEANLVWHRLHSKGGHFAAMEQPELFLGDVEEFIHHIWPVA